MPRYYFDVSHGIDVSDQVGTECVDLAEARSEASRSSTELLNNSHIDLWKGGAWTMRIRDEGSVIVGELSFTAN